MWVISREPVLTDRYPCSPSFHVLSWEVESPTPAQKGLGGRGMRREAWATGPCQPLESRTAESDHKISCWKMTDFEGKHVKMIRENGIVKLTGTISFFWIIAVSVLAFSWNAFTYFSFFGYFCLLLLSPFPPSSPFKEK